MSDDQAPGPDQPDDQVRVPVEHFAEATVVINIDADEEKDE